MNKALKIIGITLIVFWSSSLLSINYNPIPDVTNSVLKRSQLDQLQVKSYSITVIGPWQTVNTTYFTSGNKNISATYHSWFGLSPKMKCYSESTLSPCSG